MDWIVGGLLVFTVYQIHMMMAKVDTTTTIRKSQGKKPRNNKED